jgi:small subunit ribosomal protein S2
MTKKETQMLNREKIKLADQHRGIKDMRRLPDAIIIVDAQYEDTAIREAKRLDIPVIAIVDSNTDPNKVQFPIPANDDSIRTIQIIISQLSNSIIEAKTEKKTLETDLDKTKPSATLKKSDNNEQAKEKNQIK